MQTYVIFRRSAWATGNELGAAASRSTEVGNEMPADIRWLRSYVLDEADGTLGTVCVYQASSTEAIRRAREARRHAGARDPRRGGHRSRATRS